MVVARKEENWEVAKMGKVVQELHLSNYKIGKSWGCNVQLDDYNQ